MTDQTTPAGGADTKRCPICAEQVKAAALICRYCGHDFRTDVAGAPPGGGPTPVAGSSPAQQAAAPWQAPAAGQAPGWGQWGTAPGVQTAGSLPGPSNVPGTGYPVAPSHTTNGYDSRRPILRFSHTHVSGTGGMSRYGNIGVTPFVGAARFGMTIEVVDRARDARPVGEG